MPAAFWRLMAAIGAFGLGNFAVAFLVLRALDMLRPEMSTASATTAAVAFFLGTNAVGTLVSYPGGVLVDRLGSRPVLAAGYLLFTAACVVGAVGHGPVAVSVLAVAAGASAPLVSATEGTYVASLVDAEHRGAAFGISSAVAGVGDLVSSLVVGAIWASVGAAAGLGYGAAFTFLGALLLLAAPAERAVRSGGG